MRCSKVNVLASLARFATSKIKKTPAGRPELKFVGVEGTLEAVALNSDYFKDLRSRFYGRIRDRSLPPSPDHDNAILLSSGAPTYLSMKEPGMFRGRELTGFESNVASQPYSKALAEFDQARDELKSLAVGDKKFLKTISETYGEMMALYSVYDPKEHDELIIRSATEELPAKYREAGLKWVRAGLKEMTAMKARDRAVVENMISRNDSGVLFIGLWHQGSITNMLASPMSSTKADRSKVLIKAD
jgi:hypothetical protein